MMGLDVKPGITGWIRTLGAVLVYPPLLLLLPNPVNITIAPLVAGVIAGYKGGSQRSAALAGVVAGILGPAIVTFSMGPVQVTLQIMTKLLGAIGPLVPHIYYSLASALAGILAYRLTTRSSGRGERQITGTRNVDPL